MKIAAKLLPLLLVFALLITGCSGAASSVASEASSAVAKTAVRVYAIKGPSGIGMVPLMKSQDDGKAANDYTFTVASAPDEINGKLTTGEADIAALPTNVAAALYQKTGGDIQMLAVSTLGVLYMLENGDSVKSVADLKGKTIYSTGEGANPEYILRYVLEKNGLTVGTDVTLKFVTENDELATLVANGTAQVALVPEPIVSTIKAKKSSVNIALNMTDEWNTITGGASQLMMGCVVARKAFVEQNKAAVEAFLTEYKAAVEAVTADVETAASLCETYGIIPKAAVAKTAIPRCGLTFVSGNEMKTGLTGYLEVLYAANPKSIGGKLPDDGLFYIG